MNQVSFRPETPVSAVPVLPATGTPGIWAAVPVPDSTTARIMAVSSAAVRGLIAFLHSFGLERSITFPSGATILSTSVGCMTIPSFPTPAATSAIWSGVDEEPLLAEGEPARVDLVRVLWAGRAAFRR